MGLSRKHHGELNKGSISKERFTELREQYSQNGVALQQIDVYDGSVCPYHDRMKELVSALKEDNESLADKMLGWFKKNYPDI